MTRPLTIAAAQLGPIARAEPRTQVVERLLALLHTAAERGAELVVFPELALTTFFPRWDLPDDEVLSFFEREMPGEETRPLFDAARRLGVGFHLGYAELTPDGHRYNTAILVERDGRVVAKYRKVHLPGHEEPEAWRPFQHLERRYFEPGPQTFRVHRAFGGLVGIAICNDRRWPETYRVLGLQGVEVICIGYNTPVHYAPDPGQDRLAAFHNNLVMASGAYENATWVVGVAKGGVEEGDQRAFLCGSARALIETGKHDYDSATEALMTALAHSDTDPSWEWTEDEVRGIVLSIDRSPRPNLKKRTRRVVGFSGRRSR